MGVPAWLVMGCVLIVGVLRSRLTRDVLAVPLPRSAAEMPLRFNALMWVGIALGVALRDSFRIAGPSAPAFLGLSEGALKDASPIVGFGFMGLANLLEVLRLRSLLNIMGANRKLGAP